MNTVVSLAAWERWELASFNEAAGAAATGAGTAATQRRSALVAAPAFSENETARLREAARQEGYQAGFDSGRADGFDAGRDAAATEGRQVAVQLARAVSSFEAGANELEHAVADELLALALEIARKVIHQAIVVQPQTILGVVREALAQLPLQHAMIHLNTEDAALVRGHAGEQLAHAGHRVLEDPQLARGDVVIEAGGTHLDARLATRWQRVIATLDQDTPWLAVDDTVPS